eukprot:gnl/TRDRNA2_/TRDRNA2_181240_c0_seq1.p1 gnl/TRDRNA2_/TRDRNA2_181240_c0~~gnl/TRDRNA2_/TRDRNA2_181240_c0_seq1.p1  ORF type:complete len:493 (-),score=73.29 gnl/TRDRNA2_/TRDRNA2_181240_c0_seq1:361-1677(-)
MGFVPGQGLHPESMAHWEKESCAITELTGTEDGVGGGGDRLEQLRSHVESLPTEVYAAMPYYGKWIYGTTMQLVDNGVLKIWEVDERMSKDGPPKLGDPNFAVFESGDRVRVKEDDPRDRWRRPHSRVPEYIFGKTGVVAGASYGTFACPSGMSVARPASLVDAVPKYPTYRVIFKHSEVFPESSKEGDELILELKQNWLAPADEIEERRIVERHPVTGDSEPAWKTARFVGHGKTPDAACGGIWSKLTHVVKELLVEKGVLTRDAIREQVETDDKLSEGSNTLAEGLVAKAWCDEAFKKKLLGGPETCADAISEAIGSGYSRYYADGAPTMIAVENTEEIHNVVVCTLCSCWPRPLMGRPPAWFLTLAYRRNMAINPRETLKELGCEVPAERRLVVHDSTSELRFLVIPARPKGTEGLSEKELEKLVTRDHLVGVRA